MKHSGVSLNTSRIVDRVMKLKKFIVDDKIYNERLAVCHGCEYLNKVQLDYWKGWIPDREGRRTIKDDSSLGVLDNCKLCGCLMTIKARFSTAACPHNPRKWDTVQ